MWSFKSNNMANDTGNWVASYYGTIERYESGDYQHKIISQISGVDLAIAEFRDSSESEEHSAMCSDLKMELDRINHLQENWTLNMTEYKIVLRTSWLPLVDQFTTHWGRELVPHYLRRVIREVSLKVNRPPHAWPPILMIDTSGALVSPQEVDILGRVEQR